MSDRSLEHVEIPEYMETVPRKDLNKEVPEQHRPTNTKYEKFFALVDMYRRCGYNQETIHQKSNFLIQSVLFNSVLCGANRDLAALLRMEEQDASEPEQWAEQTAQALRAKLWDEEKEAFFPWDLFGNRLIKKATVGVFTPFFGGVPNPRQSHLLFERLDSVGFCPIEAHGDRCWSVPTSNMYAEEFDEDNYWRGPVWAFTNWLLMEGLRNYDEHEKARAIEEDLLQLVNQHGYSEYWDPLEGRPLGEGHVRFEGSRSDLLRSRYEKRGNARKSYIPS